MEKTMIKQAMQSDFITAAIEDMGLSLEDITVLFKGYEKFTSSSNAEKKELINKIKTVIEE
jgi:hypothetical protein